MKPRCISGQVGSSLKALVVNLEDISLSVDLIFSQSEVESTFVEIPMELFSNPLGDDNGCIFGNFITSEAMQGVVHVIQDINVRLF